MSSPNPSYNGVVIETREDFDKLVKQDIINKRKLKGLTRGQQDLLDTINTSVITLCTGPAGTGKTYIPVVRALELLKEENSSFKKIIIARPAVECGDEMGFLPGDLNEKIEPYMRPIYDVMLDYLGDEKIARGYIINGIVEFCALAYMRGRSLNNAIMILDEAQNATWAQLVMFLTRIGKDSKIIVSGDEDQKDSFGTTYKQCVDKFERKPYIDSINVVRLTEKDIVRNGIIKDIIDRLGDYEDNYSYGNRCR
jgi:phosphate starvation-inducible PhoH-like protein